MKTDYSRWMESVMTERKADLVAERVESILAIKALNLPYDTTQEMILSYKYDILEEKWKKHYRVVLFQGVICRASLTGRTRAAGLQLIVALQSRALRSHLVHLHSIRFRGFGGCYFLTICELGHLVFFLKAIEGFSMLLL